MNKKLAKKTWLEEFDKGLNIIKTEGPPYPSLYKYVTDFIAQQITTIFQEMEGVTGEDEGYKDWQPEDNEPAYYSGRDELRQEQRSRLAELKKRWVK